MGRVVGLNVANNEAPGSVKRSFEFLLKYLILSVSENVP